MHLIHCRRIHPGPACPPLPALLALLCCLAVAPAAADPACHTAAACFEAGTALYAQGEYEQAAAQFAAAAEFDPTDAASQLMLGRSWGRVAEDSNWVRAVTLAPRVLRAFEAAVRLDPDNVEALEDLAEYHRRAPGFLGGSNQRAEELEARLATLRKTP